MKKPYSFTLMAVLLLSLMPHYAWTQQQQNSTRQDSISLFQLMEQIEQHSDYRIFTTLPDTFRVKKPAGIPTLKQLEEALRTSSYEITTFRNQVFVLPQATLQPMAPRRERQAETDTDNGAWIVPEKATSENRVYEIGNKYKPVSPKQKVTLTGRISDFKSDQPLEGVHVIEPKQWITAVTDRNGNFTIELPAGLQTLNIQSMGTKQTRRQLMLYSDGSILIELEEESHTLDEVLVTSNRVENVKSTQLGMERLQPAQLKNIPTAMGEVDVLKMVQTLPGVKTVGEASNGYNVRGGATDQNLLLLNDGTIFNPNHLFGFFTAFNSDMVKDVELYKSSIPSRYGGRISSVLNITGKEADYEKFSGTAGIGAVTSKLNLEIPIVKKRMSLLMSGRTTYSDWMMKMLPKKSGYQDGRAGFWDVGATWAYIINPKNKVNVYGYYSYDRFAFNDNKKYNYSNMNFSAHWRNIINDRLVGRYAAGYDHYDYQNDETVEESSAARLAFDINQWFAKLDFDLQAGGGHQVNFGMKHLLYDINAGSYTPLGGSNVKPSQLQHDKAVESAFYVGDEWEVTPKLTVNAGLRYSIFNLLGPRTYMTYEEGSLPAPDVVTDTIAVGSGKIAKTYQGMEFRLSGRYTFNEDFSVKAGFNTMQQYIHKVSNTTIMSPTDTWRLSDPNIKPQRGWQVAAGLYYNLPRQGLELSVEGYYKRLHDYLDYRNGARLLMNHHLETDVINTEGYAYGVELQVKKPEGKLNGWMSYTYSRTFLRQNDPRIARPINHGDWYPTEYDKPHDFKFVGNYKFTRRYSMSLNVDYSTGRPTTIPAGQYYDSRLNSMQVYYTNRNSHRVPDYFRMDLSFNIEPSHHLTLLTHSSISFGVYNLTGRKNAYSIYYVTEEGKVKGYKMSIFGTQIPFITYNIKF